MGERRPGGVGKEGTLAGRANEEEEKRERWRGDKKGQIPSGLFVPMMDEMRLGERFKGGDEGMKQRKGRQ